MKELVVVSILENTTKHDASPKVVGAVIAHAIFFGFQGLLIESNKIYKRAFIL
ncbi:hypothetical protein D3C87_2149660 [compost metagenome]